MLLVLTGDIQIGKTRWLQATVGRLEELGVACEGVVAPGVWRPDSTGGSYEKLGIDNLLLPDHELVPFARRADLAQAEGTYDANNLSANVGMAWHVADEAVAQVNAHFDGLAARAGASRESRPRRLLIVDELGRLELLHDGGLTSALELLSQGPRDYYGAALVVARKAFDLNNIVERRFGEVWGGCVQVGPGEEAWRLLCDALLGPDTCA